MQRSDNSATPHSRGASSSSSPHDIVQQTPQPSHGHGHGHVHGQTSLPPGFRQRSEDSWIEVASQPSSSSLSSAAEEIFTEGLRVQHDSNARRRRRSRPSGSLQINLARRQRVNTGGSSQEEYEASESESDRAMASSTEGILPSPVSQPELRRNHNTINTLFQHSVDMSEGSAHEEEEEDDDEDDNSTALNYPRSNSPYFTPQPNAFTHPPIQRHRSASTTQSHPTRPSVHRSYSQRHSYPTQQQQQHTPYNVISPSYQADHDAALRASLSTLLSLGAAARGLPKSNNQSMSRNATTMPSSRVEPTTIRMVPESVALGGTPSPIPEEHSRTASSTPATSSPLSVPSPGADKQKRKAAVASSSQSRSSSKDRQRALKKARRITSMEDISPTLLTWALSAGVVVLFSAISFSAGYVVGRESGRAEILGQFGGAAGEAGRCSQEAAAEMGRSGLGLKRLRWSGVGAAASGVRV